MRKVLIAIALLALAVAPAVAATKKADPMMDPQIKGAHWIWFKGLEETPNAKVNVRKVIKLEAKPVAASMQISGDDEYKFWINGKSIGETVNKTGSAWQKADSYDVGQYLTEGDNLIVIQGTNAASKAGIVAAIAVDLGKKRYARFCTDGEWQAASTATGEWWANAAAEGDWQPALDYGRAEDTAPWYFPAVASEVGAMVERLKTPLNTDMVSPASVKLESSSNAKVANLYTGAPGSPVGKVGGMQVASGAAGLKAIVTCDFGKEIVGYPVLMGYSYGTTRVSVACGEFESECDNPLQGVISKDFGVGGLRWMPAERRAFRYARFTIESPQGLNVECIQAQVLSYPAERRGSFECSDDMVNKIYNTSAYTTYLCMQDFFEDGVKRDRWLWIGDLCVEAPAGYYAYGGGGLVRRSLLQLSELQRMDGSLNAVSPARNLILPDYCAYYVITLADYYRFTGDTDTVRTLYPCIKRLMDWFKANSDESGMIKNADREGWWTFVDWDTSLEKKDRVTALESVYYWALKSAAELAPVARQGRDAKAYLAQAELVRKAINSTLWSTEHNAYIDCVTDKGPSKLIHKQPNSLALLAGLADPQMASSAAASIADPAKMTPVTTPYMNFYVASALFANGQSKPALDLVRNYWGGMIQRGATTFWEKYDPNWPADFSDREMSYCHGWSAGPAAMLPAYVAGVRPSKPGFTEAVITPDLVDLEWVKATIPAAGAGIRVDWRKEQGCVVGSVTLPVECDAQLVLPAPADGISYLVDQRPAKGSLKDGRLTVRLKGGRTYVVSIRTTGTG